MGTDGETHAVQRREPELRPTASSVHTPSMTLKNAALLALIGTILMTALLLWTFVLTFLNVLRDLVPAVTLFQSFVYAFGCQCGCILLRVPSSAVVPIFARDMAGLRICKWRDSSHFVFGMVVFNLEPQKIVATFRASRSSVLIRTLPPSGDSSKL
jgi:hypothetical protein